MAIKTFISYLGNNKGFNRMRSLNKNDEGQKAKIVLGFDCNNNCIFCFEKNKRHLPPKNTAEVIKEMESTRKESFEKIALIGGEPTLRKDILILIKYAQNMGFSQIMITTNGRMFAYSDFVRKITQAGLTQVVFSLHGPNKEVHDQITGVPGSFKQLVEGIKNAKEFPGLASGTNTTIVNSNYRYLPEIARLLIKWDIKRAEFIWVYPPPLVQYKKIVPMVSKAYPFCEETLKTGLAKNYLWRILNPPLGCSFGGLFHHIRYAGHNEATLFIKTKKSRIYASLEEEKIIEWQKEKVCLSCKVREKCFGAQKRYLDCFGGKELKAVK